MNGFIPTCPECNAKGKGIAGRCESCGTRLGQTVKPKRRLIYLPRVRREPWKPPKVLSKARVDRELMSGPAHPEPSTAVPEHVADLPRETIRALLEQDDWTSEERARR